MGIPFTDLPECDRIQAWKTPRILSPGVDYPQTFQELDNWFRNDAACREYPPTPVAEWLSDLTPITQSLTQPLSHKD